MNKIDTIIFDLGAVLIDWSPMNVYLKAFNSNEKRAQWFLDNICTPSWNVALDGGKDWQEAIEEKVLEFPEYEQYIRLYRDEWELMLQGEITGTVEILEKLKASKKYRLYAITNWSDETFKITFDKYNFLKWFDGIAISGILKMIKPHKEIYLYSIKKFGIVPENSVFIDDNQANINTANALEINTILFKNPEQLEKELKEFKIEL
jgi:2-haloacid dehalogenase